MIAKNFLAYEEEKAKKRQRAAGGDVKSEYAKSLRENLPEPISRGKATDKVAKALGISGRTVHDAITQEVELFRA